MNVGVVIQARMGSTRLPGKVLKPIAGRPLLDHVLGRLEGLCRPMDVVVATTNKPQDHSIVSRCEDKGVAVFVGSENDVLDRYFRCATQFEFQHVVRLTADNPFTDVTELDNLIALHLCEAYDYTHSFDQMPIGIGAEIFSFAALARSHAEGLLPNHREHVNEYVQEHPEYFRIGRLTVPAEKTARSLRMTVDTLEDWKRACWLAESSTTQWLQTKEAIALCSSSA